MIRSHSFFFIDEFISVRIVHSIKVLRHTFSLFFFSFHSILYYSFFFGDINFGFRVLYLGYFFFVEINVLISIEYVVRSQLTQLKFMTKFGLKKREREKERKMKQKKMYTLYLYRRQNVNASNKIRFSNHFKYRKWNCRWLRLSRGLNWIGDERVRGKQKKKLFR